MVGWRVPARSPALRSGDARTQKSCFILEQRPGARNVAQGQGRPRLTGVGVRSSIWQIRSLVEAHEVTSMTAAVGKKILVADDDRTTRLAISSMLRKAG